MVKKKTKGPHHSKTWPCTPTILEAMSKRRPTHQQKWPIWPKQFQGWFKGGRPTSLKLAPCVLQVNKPPSIPKTWKIVSLSDFYSLLLNPLTLSLDHCPFVVKEMRYPQKGAHEELLVFGSHADHKKMHPHWKPYVEGNHPCMGWERSTFSFFFFNKTRETKHKKGPPLYTSSPFTWP